MASLERSEDCSSETWNTACRHFERLARTSAEHRDEGLRQLAQDDPALAARVEAMLQVDAEAAALFPIMPEEVETASMDAPDVLPEPRSGDRFGPYVIRRRLGSGGMGDVYLANLEDEPGRLVALKRMRDGLRSPGTRRRFVAEREHLRQLEHPNIVKLLDGGETPSGAPYLVMEYVDGLALDRHCARHAREVREKVALVEAVTRAVAHAHDLGIIHRDLKPGNVLVTGDGVPKVTDFGLARSASRDIAQTQLTAPGAILGTPGYAPPEQIGVGEGRNLATVDVYSLGAILYQLLADRQPYPGSNDLETCLLVLNGPPTPLRSLRPDLPRDLEAIVEKAMARSPSDRFLTAGAMADELRRYLDGRPLSIPTPTRLSRLGAWAVTHRVGLLTWGGVAGVLLIGLIGLLAFENHRREETLRVLQDLFTRSTLAAEGLTDAIPLGSDNAHDYFEQMTRLCEAALKNIPGMSRDSELRYRTALANYHLARSWEARDPSGHQAEAIRCLDRGIELLGPLAESHPEESWWRYNLFRMLSMRATLRNNQDRKLAEADARDALRVIEALARDDPAKPEWAEALATQHFYMAVILQYLSRSVEALQHARMTHEIARQLVTEYPENPLYLINVYRGEAQRANILAHAGDPDAAEAAFRKALEVNSELVKRGPYPIHHPFEGAICRMELIDLLLREGRFADAEPLLEEAQEIFTSYLERYPDHVEYRHRAIEGRVLRARLAHAMDRREEFEAAYRSIIADLEASTRDARLTRQLALLYETCPIEALRDPEHAAALKETLGNP